MYPQQRQCAHCLCLFLSSTSLSLSPSLPISSLPFSPLPLTPPLPHLLPFSPPPPLLHPSPLLPGLLPSFLPAGSLLSPLSLSRFQLLLVGFSVCLESLLRESQNEGSHTAFDVRLSWDCLFKIYVIPRSLALSLVPTDPDQWGQ